MVTAAVLEAIQGEIGLIERITVLLERERDTLKQRDTDALQAVVAEKEQALAELAAFGKRRMRLVDEAGYGSDESGMRDFLENVPESEAVRVAWDELRSTLTECQRRNQINGQVLHGVADDTRRLLSVLVGASSPDNDLYDRQGGKVSHLGGRTHTKA